MRGASEPRWWRLTAIFAGATVAAGLALALFVLLAPGALGAQTLFGLPVGTFLALAGGPVILLAATAFFAARQRALDQHHDVAEH